jgi:hypothetical protein
MATLMITHEPDVAAHVTDVLVGNGATEVRVTGDGTTATLPDEAATRTVAANLILASTVTGVSVEP